MTPVLHAPAASHLESVADTPPRVHAGSSPRNNRRRPNLPARPQNSQHEGLPAFALLVRGRSPIPSQRDGVDTARHAPTLKRNTRLGGERQE